MNVTHNKSSRTMLPILVPVKKGEPADGIANFYLEITRTESGGTRSHSGPPIRLVRQKDLPSGAAMRKLLSSQDVELLTGALKLKQSFDANDKIQAEQAYKTLWPWIDPTGGSDPSGYKTLAAFYASHPGWARLKFPQIATKAVEDARFVLWWAPKMRQFIPAIYCPTMRTAIFVHSFLGKLRVCPYCSTVFIPLKKNVDYCRPAHRDAHRMARWRAKGKAAAPKRRPR